MTAEQQGSTSNSAASSIGKSRAYNVRTGASTAVMTLAVAAWAFSVPGLNIYHHLELPSIDKYKYTVTSSYSVGLYGFEKNTDIRLSGDIKDSGYYESIANILEQAKTGDTVTFHLAGPGGMVDGYYYLANNIKSSKARVIMSVEAPAYSADAYLAVSGTNIQDLKMGDYTYLMFHFSSILNLDCNSSGTGADRGVSDVAHCQAFKEQSVATSLDMLNNVPILTSQEKADILSGHDVYLDAQQVRARQKVLAEGKSIDTIPSYKMPPVAPVVPVPTNIIGKAVDTTSGVPTLKQIKNNGQNK